MLFSPLLIQPLPRDDWLTPASSQDYTAVSEGFTETASCFSDPVNALRNACGKCHRLSSIWTQPHFVSVMAHCLGRCIHVCMIALLMGRMRRSDSFIVWRLDHRSYLGEMSCPESRLPGAHRQTDRPAHVAMWLQRRERSPEAIHQTKQGVGAEYEHTDGDTSSTALNRRRKPHPIQMGASSLPRILVCLARVAGR